MACRLAVAGLDQSRTVEFEVTSAVGPGVDSAAPAIAARRLDAPSALRPGAPIDHLFQRYGEQAHIRYGAADDRRELTLTARPEGNAVRVRVAFARKGKPAVPVEQIVADGGYFRLKQAAGQVRAVLDELDDVEITLARAIGPGRSRPMADTVYVGESVPAKTSDAPD